MVSVRLIWERERRCRPVCERGFVLALLFMYLSGSCGAAFLTSALLGSQGHLIHTVPVSQMLMMLELVLSSRPRPTTSTRQQPPASICLDSAPTLASPREHENLPNKPSEQIKGRTSRNEPSAEWNEPRCDPSSPSSPSHAVHLRLILARMLCFSWLCTVYFGFFSENHTDVKRLFQCFAQPLMSQCSWNRFHWLVCKCVKVIYFFING